MTFSFNKCNILIPIYLNEKIKSDRSEFPLQQMDIPKI